MNFSALREAGKTERGWKVSLGGLPDNLLASEAADGTGQRVGSSFPSRAYASWRASRRLLSALAVARNDFSKE